jgi:hypothetical protein
MSKPGASHASGIGSGADLNAARTHPSCRWREAQPGFRTERENLAGDAKGKGASGHRREAESTDAPGRGGPLADGLVARVDRELRRAASAEITSLRICR